MDFKRLSFDHFSESMYAKLAIMPQTGVMN